MVARSSSPKPFARGGRLRGAATAAQILIVLLVGGGFWALNWTAMLPQRVDSQQTIVVGATRLAPDSDASLRVVVHDLGAGQPIAGAEIRVSLQPDAGRAIPLFRGETDETGSLPVSFHVPADAPTEGRLIVEASSPVGHDRVEQPVTIRRDYRLLLSSDKPLYQPGQTIHMRALALSTYDLTAARGAVVDFLVQDPKGNKVYRRSVTTSDFGVAAADFTLADLVHQGSYKLSVSMGDVQSEKTVEVRPYVLPKFAVEVTTDRSFYLPGQRVEGVVRADYFFGKPVALGQVQVVGSVWDVERTVVVDLRGQTDEEGTYAFAFELPEYLAGSGLDVGQARFALEVTVIDQAEHAEQTSHVLAVAAQPLIIEAVAESGVLKPGVENIVYILTAYPDGRPAPTRVWVSVGHGEPVELSTGEFGLAEFAFTPTSQGPSSLWVYAQDESGLRASREVTFGVESGGDSVLLRADRAGYLVGETIHLVAFTPVESGAIYLDIVKAGQTLSTRSAPVSKGRAEFAVDVGPDLYGTLELHAYKALLDGTIVRDTRLVVVDAPNDLEIAIGADKDTYLPGDMATITLRTSGAGDVGVQAALGLAIVDESVFALQSQDPGFAKLYFMLERQLLEPFYQIQFRADGSSPLPPALIPPEETAVREAQDRSTKAAWAGMTLATTSGLRNSRPDKVTAAYEAQKLGFGRLGQASSIALMLVPVALWAVTLVALKRAGVLGTSLFLRLLLASAIILAVAIPLSCAYLLNAELTSDLKPLWIIWAVVIALGLLALAGYGWAKRDLAAQFLSLLALAWGALLYLLLRALDSGGQPAGGLVAAALVAVLLMPGAFLLFGQGRWVQRRRFAGVVGTGLGAVAALPLLLGLLSLIPSFGGGPPFRGAFGVVYDRVQVEALGWQVPPVLLATPAPGLRDASENGVAQSGDKQLAGAAAEPPRLRQYFPETLYWAPEVLTDEGGFVSLRIPMADSITTWRLTALASSRDGRLGFATRGVRVFQDFFVDVDLPVALTQGDEISIPVGVFNYLAEAQEVRLVVQEEPWFELLGAGEQTLTIASNDVEVVYFPIRVQQFGRQGFQVTAWGERMSDAVRREVQVVPDGKEVRMTESNWLRESREVPIAVPVEAVKGTPTVEVKIYPGVLAQVMEGLEKILRLPHG